MKILTLLTLFITLTQAQTDSLKQKSDPVSADSSEPQDINVQTERSQLRDPNISKLFTIGETGNICPKGSGFIKLGLNMIWPTMHAAYAPYEKWEFDYLWIGFPQTVFPDEDAKARGIDKKNEIGWRVLRLGFKHHPLHREKLWRFDGYDLSWGLKIHHFKIFMREDTIPRIDKKSGFLVPFLAQSFQKGKFQYHLYWSLPLGGEEYTAVGGNPRKNIQTTVFVSGLEYDVRPSVKLLMEYYFTNMGIFMDISDPGMEDGIAVHYNPVGDWLSYMFLGTRWSFSRRFYTELGLSTHISIPPFPFTGVIMNLGWYFR